MLIALLATNFILLQKNHITSSNIQLLWIDILQRTNADENKRRNASTTVAPTKHNSRIIKSYYIVPTRVSLVTLMSEYVAAVKELHAGDGCHPCRLLILVLYYVHPAVPIYSKLQSYCSRIETVPKSLSKRQTEKTGGRGWERRANREPFWFLADSTAAANRRWTDARRSVLVVRQRGSDVSGKCCHLSNIASNRRNPGVRRTHRDVWPAGCWRYHIHGITGKGNLTSHARDFHMKPTKGKQMLQKNNLWYDSAAFYYYFDDRWKCVWPFTICRWLSCRARIWNNVLSFQSIICEWWNYHVKLQQQLIP